MSIKRPLISKEVLAFLPLNEWTKVILLSSTPDKYGVYMVTTEDKKKKRLEDMKKISMMSNFLQRVQDFKLFQTVAVEIDGDWFRGNLLCYNEFLPNDTLIELIDVGSVYETKLQNVYELPLMLYEPLSLPIRFKNFIPKTKELTIRPLLSESFLQECVVVDVKSNINLDNIQNEKQQLEVKKDLSTPKIQNITNDNSDVNILSSFLSKSLMNGYYTQIKPKKNDFMLKNGDYCKITFFEDFTCLYVCKALKTDENNYDVLDFDLILKTADSTDKILLPNPVVGDIVKVCSSEFENVLFRAKVLRKKKDGSYVVFFIDYGNTETVQSDVIYKLADELKKPGLAVKIGMNALNHDIKCTNEIKQMFKNYVDEETPFIIEFDKESENFTENVILKDAVNGYYINSSFIKKYLPKKSELGSDTQINENTSLVYNGYNDNNVNNLKNNDIVYLKHFEDMSSVFIIKDVKLFNKVMISTIKDKSNLRKTDFIKGDIVKVKKLKSKNLVYRAKIKEINGTSVDVINVDIGYSDLIQSDSIYELPDDLKKIPGLAIKVGIKKPIFEKSSFISEFIDNIETVPLYLKFDENNLNKYQDVILNRVDNSQNIFEEFVKTCETANKKTLQTIENKFISNGIGNKKEKEEFINGIKPCLINDFENIQLINGDYCFVSYFKNFENIYLCKAVKDCSDNLYKLHNRSIIEETLLSKDFIAKKNPAVGEIVKVLSPTFKDFYRAEIKNVINTDFYVSHIDFGSTEVVKLDEIFELSNELKKENKLPIKVSIEVPPNAETNDDIEMLFNNLINNNVVLSIEFKNKSTKGLENVILKELESGNLVNDKVLILLPIQKPNKLKNGQICYLRHFENFDSIYVSKIEDSQILYDTNQSTDRKTKTNPAVGDMVKVLSPSFEDFYRAEIINIVGNAKYLVFYIDFGNTEVVQSKHLFELSDDLNKKPGIAIKIGINIPHNVEPNDDIRNMFLDLAEKEELIIIEFNESSDIGLNNCILKVKSSDILINNKVTELVSDRFSILNKINDCEIKIEENLKSSDFKSSQIKPKLLKNGEKVFYRYFHNSNSVFVGKESKHQQFLTMMECIQTTTDISRIKKSNIEIGDIVKAKFDDLMYRAKILQKVNENHYCVFFIDFGNQDTVHVNDIFELPDELKLIPGLCIEIGIKGLPIIDETKKKMVTDSLEQLELTPLYIEYDENISNGLEEATLRYCSNNKSVFDDIFERNNILNIKRSKGIKSGDHVTLLKCNTDTVYVRNSKLFDSCKHKLEQLKSLEPENLVSVNPKLYDYVAVYSRKYNGCFRANVIGQIVDDSGKFFKCSLIDKNRSNEDISSKNIYELPNDYTMHEIPNMVHKVKLSGLKNKKLDSYLSSSLGGKQFVLEFDENADRCLENVVLKDIESKKSLNQEIQELMINNSPPISQQRRLERKIVLPSKVENKLEKSSYPIKSGASVFITHFENFNSIFIRDGSFECNEKFDGFKKQMLKYYRIAKTKELVNIGDNVGVMCDAMYSRAIVKDKIGKDYLVFCVDVGNTELVDIDDIYELPNELEKEPPYFAIKVQFKNMPPIPSKNEIQTIREYFEKKFILPKTKVFIKFDELNPKGLEDVTLRTEFTNKDICDELKHVLNIEKTGLLQNGQQNFNPNLFTKLPYRLRNQSSKFK